VDNKYAGSAIGTALRGLASNTQRRTRLLNIVEELDSLSNKYGRKFDDDVISQTAFTIDLDKMFGTKADTSFAGQVAEGIANAPPTTAYQALSATAKAAIKQARGIDQQAQFRAMEELLKSFD
jgi:hypothetical protein